MITIYKLERLDIQLCVSRNYKSRVSETWKWTSLASPGSAIKRWCRWEQTMPWTSRQFDNNPLPVYMHRNLSGYSTNYTKYITWIWYDRESRQCIAIYYTQSWICMHKDSRAKYRPLVSSEFKIGLINMTMHYHYLFLQYTEAKNSLQFAWNLTKGRDVIDEISGMNKIAF